MARIVAAVLLVGWLVGVAQGDVTIVDENFDSYADDAAFRAVWEPTVGNGSAPADPIEVESSILTADDSMFPGIQGKAIDHLGAASPAPGMVNQYFKEGLAPAPDFTVGPTSTQNLVLTADMFASNSGNERMTVGLRSRTSVQNILEIGLYNDYTCDPTVAGCVPTTSPMTSDMPGFKGYDGFGFRAILLESFGGDLVAQPNWQVFDLPQELDRDSDLDEFVTIGDIGAGWHRFEIEVAQSEITFSIDLFRDGLRNTSITPDEITGIRPGSPGFDASITYELVTSANGFDSLRIGGPSGTVSNGPGAVGFDNILLKLVDLAPGNSADFNGNGTVDAADYTLWRDNLGLVGTGTQATGDANGDTNIDVADYDVWKSTFGTTLGSGAMQSATVPEPSAVVLLLVGCIASWNFVVPRR